MPRRYRAPKLTTTKKDTKKVDANKIQRQINKFSSQSASSYWMDFDYNRYYDPINGTYNMPADNVFELAKYQRAIGNFVKIVSGKDIPVRFSQKDDSYTDGKVVTITKNIKPQNFDVVVGLACHEAAHVLLSKFSIRTFVDMIVGDSTHWTDTNLAKTILNVIEDRRIDAYVRRVAPGYNSYYDAMYNHYFNDKNIICQMAG